MQTLIHILHLEDDPVDAELIQARLEETGLVCRITLTQSQDEFEAALGDGGIDIILADYSLPSYDGMAALRRTLELCPDTPFIFVTGAMGEEAAIEALTHGATDYVLKQNLSRLPTAVGRALRDARNRLDRKQAREALRASEARYIDLYDNAPDMHLSINTRTASIEKCNRPLADTLGCPKEEIIGRSVFDIFHTDCLDQAKEIFEEFLGNGIIHDKELQLRKKDGSKLYVSLNASAVRTEDGTICSSRSTLRDITQRKQAEQQVAKLSHAIEQSPVSIVITDVEGRIEFVNAKFTRITGYSRAEVLGRNPQILKSGETRAEEYTRLWRTISSGSVWRGEFQNRKKNGELFWEYVTIAPVRDADKVITHYVAVMEDITERKGLEEQLRRVQKMEAIGQLAGGIAHDFNNILSAITGYTEIAGFTIESENPASEYLAQVLKASFRAKELINQILMFSRETEQDLMPIQISLPVKEALKLIRASVPATIEIRTEYPARASALADPTHIHQIVMNLCTNAVHAMQESGGRLDIHLTDIVIDPLENQKHYPDARPGEYIRLSVADQGHGIDAHNIHRIFDPFFTTKRKGDGTGMGLSVVHGIVKSYGGFIYVRSHPGEGTTFDILIPALECAETCEPSLEKPIPTGSESILFVDDEEMITDIGKNMLESLGYRVVAKNSAIEALAAFENNPEDFDLVVTDMAMPKMTGLDLAEKITRIRTNFPIVLCTGFGIAVNEEKTMGLGVRDIIFKPILRRDLATAVRKALDEP